MEEVVPDFFTFIFNINAQQSFIFFYFFMPFFMTSQCLMTVQPYYCVALSLMPHNVDSFMPAAQDTARVLISSQTFVSSFSSIVETFLLYVLPAIF